MMKTQRIVFAGTPDFAVPTLGWLAESGHELVAVLTQPDRPAGRGRKMRESPVKMAAAKLAVEILQPKALSEPGVQDQIKRTRPDLMIVVAYGLLLPKAVLDIPRLGCLNIHASLLPRWRGASPIQSAILAGDRETGVSIMQMQEGLDTGPVFATARTDINNRDTAGTLHDRLAELGARQLAESLGNIVDENLLPQPQTENGATYARRISKSDALIDWRETATRIDRKIRAYDPWPVAETLLDGKRIRCWSALPSSPDPSIGSVNTEPGTVVAVGDAAVTVQTGDGWLDLTSLQLPGRQKVSATDLARGYPLLDKILGR